MHFCTVNVSNGVVICTLSSTHWQQASKLSALRCFELIRKDCDKCAHQYNNNNNPSSVIIRTGWLSGESIGLEIQRSRV